MWARLFCISDGLGGGFIEKGDGLILIGVGLIISIFFIRWWLILTRQKFIQARRGGGSVLVLHEMIEVVFLRHQ